MKKLGIILAVALAALVFASCEQSKTITPAQADDLMTITANRAGFSTRSALSWETFSGEYYDGYYYSYEWYAINWSAPDKILAGYPGGDLATFTSTNTSPAPSATFKGTLPVHSEDDVLVGVYPADNDVAVNMMPATVSLPFHDQQTAVEGSYDPMAFPAIAASETNNLNFFNICGLLQFRLFEEGIDEIVLNSPFQSIPGGIIEVAPNVGGYAERSRSSNGRAAFSNRPAERMNRNNPKTRSELLDDDFDDDYYDDDEFYSRLEPEIISGDEITTISLKAPSGQTLKPGKDYFMSVPPMNFNYNYCVFDLKYQGEIVKSFDRSGVLNRSSICPVPLADVYDFSDFAGGWYFYNEDKDGYEFIFFEEMPEGDPRSLWCEPFGRYLVVDIPAVYLNGTCSPANNLNTGWYFYIGFFGTSCWQFQSGEITLNFDKNTGTVDFSVDCQSSYDHSIKSSYSGSVIECDEYMWEWLW